MATAPSGIAERSSRKAQLNGQTAEMPGVAMLKIVRYSAGSGALLPAAWSSSRWRRFSSSIFGVTKRPSSR